MIATMIPQAAYNVVVIGGGPAGTTLATLLQRQGHRCLVLESSAFPRYHIGESLIPNTYGVLDRLGLLPQLEHSRSRSSKRAIRFPFGRRVRPVLFL